MVRNRHNITGNFLLILITGIILLNSAAMAQMGATALLIGKVTDNTGQPLGGVKFALNADGKKIRGKTGSDGTFQQVVKPGTTYIIEWQHPTAVLKRDTAVIPRSDKYLEQHLTFSPAMFRVGDALASCNCFTRGTAAIVSESEMQSLAGLLKDYSRLSVGLTVSDDMPDPKAKKVKAKPAKKPKKGKNIPEPAPAPSLASQRLDALTAYFSKNYPELVRRITVMMATAPTSMTVVAKVAEIQPEM